MKHPSHKTRFSLSSSYDEVCELCGATDGLGTWGKLAEPCPTFQREERYIVIKRKHLTDEDSLRNFLAQNKIPTIESVVIESDWPEYEVVWSMTEERYK